MSELSHEILLLQVILPALLEQKHTRRVIHQVLRVWTHIIAWALGLQSYLLGRAYVEQRATAAQAPAAAAGDHANDNDEGFYEDNEAPAPAAAAQPAAAAPANANANAQPAQDGGFFGGGPLGVAHVDQLLDQDDVFVEWEPYDQPTFFPIRVRKQSVCVCIAHVKSIRVDFFFGGGGGANCQFYNSPDHSFLRGCALSLSLSLSHRSFSPCSPDWSSNHYTVRIRRQLQPSLLDSSRLVITCAHEHAHAHTHTHTHTHTHACTHARAVSCFHNRLAI